jgi:hypothetical protein
LNAKEKQKKRIIFEIGEIYERLKKECGAP